MNDLAQAFTASDVQAGDTKAPARPLRMGRLLLQTGKVTTSQINAIIALQAKEDLRFGEAAVKLGVVDADGINAILARQFAYPCIDIEASQLSRCLISAFQPASKAAEALRSLRSELMLRFFNRNAHSALALADADDARSISHTSANLAICCAQSGARTLLIDANLRQPELHRWFGIDNRQPGLSDLLAGRARARPSAVPELGPLWVLPAGTPAPNPQELLAGRFKEQLHVLHQDFDVVLINTSPLGTTYDAQLVAAHTGAALLVTRKHHSRLKYLEQVCANLEGAGVRLLGAVLRE